MGKKKESDSLFVYSTDPGFSLESDKEELATLAPHLQVLKISLETKHRAGKTVTLVAGFVGSAEDMEALGKKLKNHCGTGGTAKDGEIIVQGDHREKVRGWLQKNQYKTK